MKHQPPYEAMGDDPEAPTEDEMSAIDAVSQVKKGFQALLDRRLFATGRRLLEELGKELSRGKGVA